MEKVQEQWKVGKGFKYAVRQTLNFVFGCSVLCFTAIALSFFVGIAVKIIVTFFKYGYGLW